jgi:hypothetical protein
MNELLTKVLGAWLSTLGIHVIYWNDYHNVRGAKYGRGYSIYLKV